MTTTGSEEGPEQVPDRVVAEAQAAFGRRIGGELAVLVRDTLIDRCDPAADHRLRFEHPALTLELQVSATAGGSSLRGTVHPTTSLRVQLEFAAGATGREVDATSGGFVLDRIPHGLVRLHLLGPGDTPPIHTDWFRI
jgi:hypothetical protein